MNITVIAVGKLKDKSLRTLQEEYTKRLTAFCRVEIIEVKDEPEIHPDRENECRLLKEKEGQRVLEKIRPDDYCVLLDLHGTQWTSEEFASQLESWQGKGKRLVFIIAGSLGPSPELVLRSDIRWKLSDLTFTHMMTRILILEQIYRGFMIQSGRDYHK